MPISTNSIIHYTKKLDTLKMILKEGFKIKYCVESLIIENKAMHSCHPMISFCDIPLSESSKHFNAYGSYGIGLSKKWANSLGTNPVLYLENNSIIGKSIYDQFVYYLDHSEKLSDEQKLHIRQIKAHTKNYSGPLKRNKVDDPNYKFYDEREWRFIPREEEIGKQMIAVRKSSYTSDKDTWNGKIDSYRYEFKANEISYLIVKNDKEIVELINFLRAEFASKCTARELDVLFSKICSIEQIGNDY